jgi:putative endonuclease
MAANVKIFMKTYFVYIIASQENGTIYIGVTNNLSKRVWEHKNKIIQGFTSKYNVNKLVYYESYTEIESAITREKVLKKWNRQWKINLIKKDNPNWLDLSENGHF